MTSDSKTQQPDGEPFETRMAFLEEVAGRLRRRDYDVEVFFNGIAAAERIREIVRGKSVGHGSSMTLETLGLTRDLEGHAAVVYSHRPGEAGSNERDALTADVFLSSVNAMSADGHIVNIDGTGNRVAATCFGPKQVIFLAGVNKITESLEAAHVRAKDAAVRLAAHYGRKTPCARTGACTDCLSSECICSVTTVHRKKPLGSRISVFLINENLGL